MTFRKPTRWLLSALAAAIAFPGAGMAAEFSADYFSAKGWVKPGETYPFTLSYDAEGNLAAGSIVVTLPNEATYSNASIAPSSVSGQTITFDLGASHGSGKIIVWATAADQAQDPQIIWKNLSANATYTVGGDSIPKTTLGPKVTELDTARYGKRPFPLVMVEYQDITHCTAPGDPYPECTGNHTAAALDVAVNSRTSGRSLWQLYQDMSFGQLSPEGQVGPQPGTPDTSYDPTYNYKWSTPTQVGGACTGTTTAPTGEGVPLTPHPRIINGWYRLPGTQGYYGSDKLGHGAVSSLSGVGLVSGIDDACGPTGKMAYDAAAIADQDLDYNEFDTDKDGVVDFLNVAFAGDGGNLETSATGLNNVWPHKSDLQYYFTDENGERGYVSNDQLKSHAGEPMYWTDAGRTTMTTDVTAIPVMVRVGPYNVNPESAVDKMSVIAHEYGHSLGLPDFYSTGGRSTFGSWELMASDHSQFMTVFTRQDMGWIVPRNAADLEDPNNVVLRESKTDTGTIHWKDANGNPYTLTGAGIHNADALKFPQPTGKVIDDVGPGEERAWHSGAGNDYACPNTNIGVHVLDVLVPEMEQAVFAGASNITLEFESLYEIEWDWDYAFMMVSTDNGATWQALPSQAGTTITSAEYNPQQQSCFTTLDNGITGVSGVPNTLNPTRLQDDYPVAEWITDSYDLTAFAGNKVIIRFGYFTDGALAKRGWFIDDLKLTADGTTIYESSFEGSEEELNRLFPTNWSRVSTAEGLAVDHAYYVELRDKVSWDFDGKDQSDRGAPTWQPGVAILYTDETHGYGNTGVDNPPAQTIVDSQPAPGSDTPNLDDASFNAEAPRDVFNGCTHVDNYDTPTGAWKLPTGARVYVDSVTGLSTNGVATGNAQAQIRIEADPQCDLNTAGPVLSIGAGYEDPDADGSYQLTWVPTESANGPNELQEATTLATLVSDGAEGDMSNWVVSSEGDPVLVPWQPNPARPNSGTYSFHTVVDDDARSTSSIMTLAQPINIPAEGATTLSFYESLVGELDDQGFVEASIDGGVKWEEIYSTSGPYLVLDGEGPITDPLTARQIDLSSFAGYETQLRFRYFVGASNYVAYTPLGWFVDDIQIDTANWADIASTTDTSFVRSDLTDGHYYYRVRSSHQNGTVNIATNWSNIEETDVVIRNQAPNAVNDEALAATYKLITVNVLANDSDPDGDTLTVTGITQGANSFADVEPGTSLVYFRSHQGFEGVEVLTYTVSDGNGNSSTATLTVTVEANDPPVVGNDSASVARGGMVTIDVLANDSDPDGDTLTIDRTSTAGHGTMTINADQSITYTHNGVAKGCDVFFYFVQDGYGHEVRGQVDVCVPNTNPVAADDYADLDQDTSVTVSVLANDSDADGDVLTVTSFSQPLNGTVVRNGDNSMTYTPNANFVGNDAYNYTVSDGQGGTATATVYLTVNEVAMNTNPNAADDSATTDQDAAVSINVLGNDNDADGDALTITSVSTPANGTATINGSSITYTPNAGYYGNDSFTYTISDGQGGSDSATVTVTVNQVIVNAAPVAADDTASTRNDLSVTIDVLANDSDADGDSLTITDVEQPLNGSAVLNADGTITYTADTGFVGNDSFYYSITDGNGGSDRARVVVAVSAAPGGGGGGDDGDSDSDDFDSDGKRDDIDSDDDNDGIDDDVDSDDDNDGIDDDADSDDDNDGVKDDYDSQSHKDKVKSAKRNGKAGDTDTNQMAANPATVLLMAVVSSDNPSALSLDILDPTGAVVATGALGINGLTAVAIPAGIGQYTVSVVNNADAEYELTVLTRDAYLP